jgi:hypothetical protein
MNEDNADAGFWALVEMMGHQKMVGLVRETKLAGAGFLQVDSLDENGKLAFSRYLSPGAIYAINPISKELAEALAKTHQPVPVHEFDVPQLRDKIRKELTHPYPEARLEDFDQQNEDDEVL